MKHLWVLITLASPMRLWIAITLTVLALSALMALSGEEEAKPLGQVGLLLSGLSAIAWVLVTVWIWALA